MKTKMSLSAEMDLTQDSVVQLTCWCGQIALHELWGLGRTRLDRITRRKELLCSQSLAVVMQPDKNGMPQTEKARRLRAEAIPKGVPTEFRVPALRTPRTRREQQLKMVGDRAATMAWQLMALACVQELGFGADRLNRLYAEMRHNYEQLNEWGKTDGLDVAMDTITPRTRLTSSTRTSTPGARSWPARTLPLTLRPAAAATATAGAPAAGRRPTRAP